MRDNPDISRIAALLGDPARSSMVVALVPGMALTASELGGQAGVGKSTASLHLAKLAGAGLVVGESEGRHRYFRMANDDIAAAVKALSAVAARAGHLRKQPGPTDAAMRGARSCYGHLAGQHAVALFDNWMSRGVLERRRGLPELSAHGRRFLAGRGLDVAALSKDYRRALCRPCLDWSERKHHLAGTLGAAVLDAALLKGWAAREGKTRVIRFSRTGMRRFQDWYS